jgi:hypothetical protein
MLSCILPTCEMLVCGLLSCEITSYVALWSSINEMWFDLWSFIVRDDGGVWVVHRCRGLSKVWYGGEDCDLHDLWLVFLESAKELFLGVDPSPTPSPGQHVSPVIRYGKTCLLIRNTSGCVSDLVEWRGTVSTSLIPPGARGAIAVGNLSIATVLWIP